MLLKTRNFLDDVFFAARLPQWRRAGPPPAAVTIASLKDVVDMMRPCDRRIHVQWVLSTSSLVAALTDDDDGSSEEEEEQEEEEEEGEDEGEDRTKKRLRRVVVGLDSDQASWRRILRSGLPLSAPLCSIDCADPVLVLRVLEFWAVDWSRTPRPFLGLLLSPYHPAARAVATRLQALASAAEASYGPALENQIKRLAKMHDYWDIHHLRPLSWTEHKRGQMKPDSHPAMRMLNTILVLVDEDAAAVSPPHGECLFDKNLLAYLLELLLLPVQSQSQSPPPSARDGDDAWVLSSTLAELLSSQAPINAGADRVYAMRPCHSSALLHWCSERLEEGFRRMERIEPPKQHATSDMEKRMIENDRAAWRSEDPSMVPIAEFTEAQIQRMRSEAVMLRAARRTLVRACLVHGDAALAQKCANGSCGVPPLYQRLPDTWGERYWKKLPIAFVGEALILDVMRDRTSCDQKKLPIHAMISKPAVLELWLELWLRAPAEPTSYSDGFLDSSDMRQKQFNELVRQVFRMSHMQFPSRLVLARRMIADAPRLFPSSDDVFWHMDVKHVFEDIAEASAGIRNDDAAAQQQLLRALVDLAELHRQTHELVLAALFAADDATIDALALLLLLLPASSSSSSPCCWQTTGATDTDGIVELTDKHFPSNDLHFLSNQNPYLKIVRRARRLGCPWGPEAGWYTHAGSKLRATRLAELNTWIAEQQRREEVADVATAPADAAAAPAAAAADL